MDFDFEKMMVLARDNPEEFERQRIMLLDGLIQSRPDIKWANAFQSHIDMERIKAKTPLACCLRLYSMMWESFLNLDEQMQRLLRIQGGLHALGPPGEDKTSQPGGYRTPVAEKVLMFRKR